MNKQPPPTLRAYIGAASITALTVVCALVVSAASGPSTRDLLIGLQVAALVALARCYPIHLAAKSKLSLDTAPTLAALVLLPPGLAVISVSVGMLLGELRQRSPGMQLRFNVAVAALRTAAGVAIYQAVAGGATGTAPGAPEVVGLGGALLAMIVTSAVLVDIAVVMTMRRPMPMAQVWTRHSSGLGHEAALALLGLFTAYVAVDMPWVLALMALPGALIYVSLRDGVALRQRTMVTLTQLADLAEGSPLGGAAHGERVAQLCLALAKRLGLQDTNTDALAAAGRLHQLAALAGEGSKSDGAALAATLLSGEDPAASAGAMGRQRSLPSAWQPDPGRRAGPRRRGRLRPPDRAHDRPCLTRDRAGDAPERARPSLRPGHAGRPHRRSRRQRRAPSAGAGHRGGHGLGVAGRDRLLKRKGAKIANGAK